MTNKILIIDDSETILYKLKKAFLNTPYYIETITNPVKAFQKIQNEHFDIVISDIVMPEMDGLTLLRKIKAYNGMIQILIMTAHITIHNTLNAFRYGASDILFKPFRDTDDVVKAVDTVTVKLDRVNSILRKIAKEKRAIA